MSIEIIITDGPLQPTPATWGAEGAGAVVTFDGVVRRAELGRQIDALDYDVYEPMASQQLRRLAQSIADVHGLIAVRVEHSRGRVAVEECSFRLQIASAHRKEAIQAMDVFIDQMKQDVPIWKKPVFAAE